MKSVIDFVRALGAARIAAMGAVALGLVGFFVFLMVRLSQPQMAVLFTDLPFEDSIQIVKKLEGMNVPHQLRQEGGIILVPRDKVLRIRMTLAESGLPAGGTVGYEIFDKSDTLGATSFVQNINHLRAIEGELARTIRALDRVQAARVHLVLPHRKLFARKSSEPSASIVVKVSGRLEPGQIRAIQHLVASAVEELKPARVSIVDESGRLLANGRGDNEEPMSAAIEERNRAFETRLQNEIEEIVGSIVGPDRVRVRVTAEIDYNKITETSDIYDPNGQVIRSTQSREENSANAGKAGDDGVSVGNELPAANASRGGKGTQQETASKTEEIINYEISRTTKTEVAEGGRIKRLSVAVLVDGIYQKGADGALTYAPRPQEQLNQIGQLVRSAVGFDKTRGDQVHVANLPFVDSEPPALAPSGEGGWMSLTTKDYFRFAELAIFIVVTFLVLLFVIRPLIRRIVTPDENAVALDDSAAKAQLAKPEQAQQPERLMPPAHSAASEALKNAKVIGEVQANAIREVGEIVDNNPEEAVNIVRDWIQQTA